MGAVISLKSLRCASLACLLLGLAPAAEPALKIDLGRGATLDLRLVHAGEFTQGSPAGETGRSEDETARPVRLSHDYYVSRTSITRGQWAGFIAETGYRSEAETGASGGFGWDGAALSQRKEFSWKNPGFSQTDAHPVCLVTFADAEAFCRWLQKKTGRPTRLPTEAEWEYACRAGTTTAWYAGATPADADRIAWHQGNAGNGTRPVDSRPANPWDLIIGGNVSEWCLDWYAPYPAGAAVDPRQDNPNLSDKPRRVLRGGSWLRNVKNTRSAARYRVDARSRNADIGFRIVCEVTPVASPGTPPPLPEKPSTGMAPPLVPPSTGTRESSEPVLHDPPPAQTVTRSSNPVFSGLSSLLGGLVCLALPIGIVFLVVRSLNARRSASTSSSSSPPGYLPRQVAAPSQSNVRKVDDGFWIQGDWPAGTMLNLHYLVQGAAMAQSLMYRPGPEGHFVYTGTPPDSVSIAMAGAAGGSVVEQLVDSIGSPGFRSSSFPSRTVERHTPSTPAPPRFPSAY